MNSQIFEPTPEQQGIIDHEGSAFVTACPGAGKTRVMTERARKLFANLPPGRGVAFLSFTQYAVFELETRLREERILPSPAFPSFIGTFDSFVWHFLVAPFGVKNCDLRPRLIADLADIPVTPFNDAHPLPLSCFCPVTGEIFEQAAKRRGFDISLKPTQQVQAYMTAATGIRAGLRARGQLGFDDARSVALERLRDTDVAHRIASALAGRFCEIIVDEAQDCNPDDLDIISWLRDSGLPVKIVCDPHQSIYQFRGGVTDHLFTFKEKFADDDCKILTGNFRSAPNICKSTVQFRELSSRTSPDNSLGRYKDDATPIRILAYPGSAVPATIGVAFHGLVKAAGLDIALSPIIAATKATGSAASGQPRPSNRSDRAVRLAEAVTDFHFAAGFNDMRAAIDQVHQILLELEGHLSELSYRQYLAANEIEQASWRPRVLFLLRELRFDPSKHTDAKAWHTAAKDLLARHLTLGEGPSLSQRLKWNNAITDVLAPVSDTTAMSRTIHSVKGMEYPAVCVVTTAATLKKILDYLETGEPSDSAEEVRKLYVAVSRAERLLVIAAPKSQATRLGKYLSGQGAVVEVENI